ncbi:DUF2806 domain-containing protein [Eggerthella sinensis]|nr:DUF2806 domain-containing protein [Eggerthella sinensis]RNM40270.1 hypothetical protein DMP09_15055 [Eggerthella sinensis]
MLDPEINGIKGEFHYHAPDNQYSKKGIIRKIREAIDPEAAEMIYSKRDRAFFGSLKEIADDLVSMGTPPQYALCQAYEIKRGADRLTNVAATMRYAEDSLEEDKEYSLPSDRFNGHWLPAAEKATEDYMRETLGKILAGEMEHEGSFSNRTIAIVDAMSMKEVEIFKKLCANALGTFLIGNEVNAPASCLVMDEGTTDSFNGGSVSLGELNTIDSIGLIASGSHRVVHIPVGTSMMMYGSSRLLLSNTTETVIDIDMPGFMFTDSGMELSTLFEFACGDELKSSLIGHFETSGISVKDI